MTVGWGDPKQERSNQTTHRSLLRAVYTAAEGILRGGLSRPARHDSAHTNTGPDE